MSEKSPKSYKLFVSSNGSFFGVLIVNKNWPVKELNKLLRDGMDITAVDERSDLVNKTYVD